MNTRDELNPRKFYNEAEMAQLMGVKPIWLMERYPEFREGKKWLALGSVFEEVLRHRAFPRLEREDKSELSQSTHGLAVLGRPEVNNRF